MRSGTASSDHGAASVEYAALIAVVGLIVLLTTVGLHRDPPADPALGSLLARRVACAPRLPGPCRRDPLTAAYGRSLAGAIRALAPVPRPAPAPAGALLPVDFRRCRRPSCAIAGASSRLTTANRLVTLFVSARRFGDEGADIDYWAYRPGLGWDGITRRADPAAIRAGSRVALPEDVAPRLVALETLDGRNHYDFPAAEEPPWRWRVTSR